MKLTDLDPRWLTKDGTRVGFTFLCPCCQKDRLTCFVEPTPFREQVKMMHAAFHTVPEDEEDWPINWVPCGATNRWTLSNLTDFSTLTVTPSIDASASGNWHGFVTNGETK
jgi:hypothetical protein